MLKSLYAKNFILIEQIRVEFDQGLNIITGETGAGKSILLGALGAILGDRLNKDVVRGGAEKAVIEAEFQGPFHKEISEYLDRNDLDTENEIVIRREITVTSKSRCFINDTPVRVQQLVELGDMLVDLHGQHQHQLLLNPVRHIDYLDDYTRIHADIAQLQREFSVIVQLIKQAEEFVARKQQADQERTLAEFQLKEISTVDPQPEEDEVLSQEERVLGNSEVLFEKTSHLNQQLYENDGSASELLNDAQKSLETLAEIDSRFNDVLEQCRNAAIYVDEISRFLRNYCDNITFDAEQLENVRIRKSQIAGLKKKFGGTIDAVLTYKEQLSHKIDQLDNLDEAIVALHQQIEEKRKVLKNICLSVSGKRRAAAKEMSAQTVAALAFLGMEHARFDVSIRYKIGDKNPYFDHNGERIQVGAKGSDVVEFFITANPGDDLKPLAHVASGGEVSRIMLALKTLLAEVDRVPVLVFDEVDIGISGRIAQAVGSSLKRLASARQVICITHLPQIASAADVHFLVEKRIDNLKTTTVIRKLTYNERIEQVARLFGGEQVTDAHLQSAKDLMNEAKRIVH
ncbi:DNA repair protein RecN [candidate division KSB1 bacterium]|nr:DNA repair protein RecN [candidate division KSB1 bacterium]